jgi:hypothetical protein
MYELTGKISDLSLNFKTGKAKLTLELNEKNVATALYDELNQVEKLSVKIAKFRNKRSLDANAYCWVLLDKLSEKLNRPKVELYREEIRGMGGISETVCVVNDAVEKLRNGWERNGIGWLTETMPSKIEGCTNVTLYYGSSTFDTEQMSRLISNIVQDCQAEGIDTRTPDELANLLSLWGE